MSQKNEAPKHIALIMDGNGRWAQSRGLPRLEGHRKGAETVRHLVAEAPKLGVETLTFYAFSSENWKRPEDEVKGLMLLLKSYFSKELKKIAENNVRIRIFGDTSPEGKLGKEISEILRNAEEETRHNTALNVNFCINYGGRDEIKRAVQKISSKIASGIFSENDITEDMISNHMDSAGLADPEVMVRTGGDSRISNFLLWQTSYSELMFVETLWPDFTSEHLANLMDDYMGIDRRFGGLNES